MRLFRNINHATKLLDEYNIILYYYDYILNKINEYFCVYDQ